MDYAETAGQSEPEFWEWEMSAKRIGGPRLLHLQAFVAAADCGTKVAAAKALGCDQSTITKAITELEQWLGPVLMSSGTTDLTEPGAKFLPVARNVVDLLIEARTTLRGKPASAAKADPKAIKV